MHEFRRALTIWEGINLGGAVNSRKRILVGVQGDNYVDSRIQESANDSRKKMLDLAGNTIKPKMASYILTKLDSY